jgi:predicted short-subunit dehydrogenase-like oxidoreductase (DUF2520 family)
LSPNERPATALFGAGRLARALLPHLASAGYPVVAVCDRRLAAARGAARAVPGARATTDPLRAARDAELLLLAVPDTELAALALLLADAPGIGWRGRTVLHHAGALGPESLAPLKRRGASVGLLHPLQCLGSTRLAAELLPGSHARIEGTPKARRLALRLAREVGLIPLRTSGRLTPGDRTAYHAAASLLSNDVVALLGLGAALLESIGIDRSSAVAALASLVRGTVVQAGHGGLAAALSGPVVRGDAAALSAHLKALSRRSAAAAETHRLLSRALLGVAESEGTPPAPAARRALRAALRAPAGGGSGGPTV